jgi:ribonuclease Z
VKNVHPRTWIARDFAEYEWHQQAHELKKKMENHR